MENKSSGYKSFFLTIFLIIAVGGLFYFVYVFGTSYLLYDTEKVDANNILSTFAALFGSLITVFVALFSIEKWWDRKAFDDVKNELEIAKKQNKVFRDDLLKELEEKTIPSKIQTFIKENEAVITDPINRILIGSYGFYASILHIEFLESVFDSMRDSLKERDLCVFSRKIFNVLVGKIRNYPEQEKLNIIEKSLSLLSKILKIFFMPEMVVETDLEFAENLEYIHFEMNKFVYSPQLAESLSFRSLQDQQYKDTLEMLKNLYGKFVSHPER